MKSLRIVLSGIIISVLAISCAKERPIDELDVGVSENWIAKDKLNGNWLTKQTVVKTSGNDAGQVFIGLQSSQLQYGHFEFSENRLRFVSDLNVNNTADHIATQMVDHWPITHHDVRLDDKDTLIQNEEIEDQDKFWKDKRQFAINWTGVQFDDLSRCWKAAGGDLVPDSFEADGNSINFTVQVDYRLACRSNIRRRVRQDYTFTVHWKYSFVKYKPNPGYKKWQYTGETDPLMKKYGFFQTVREYLNEKDGRYRKAIFMNRWDPNKTHTFYFDKDFPEEYKWIFNDPERGIFPLTNKLMADNGLKVRWQVKENTGQKFGDLRYSFIKMVNQRTGWTPLGYGPSDANPLTGELIAANLNLWGSSLKYYVSLINRLVERTSTKKGTSSLFEKMSETFAETESTAMTGAPMASSNYWTTPLDLNDGAGKIFSEILPDYTFAYTGWANYTNRTQHDEDGFDPNSIAGVDLKRVSELMKGLNPHYSPAADFLSEYQTHAHDAMKEMHNEARHQGTTVYPMETAMIEAKALLAEGMTPKELIHQILYRVAIHEFGHNLNLRHNFYGSLDSKNFAPAVKKMNSRGKLVEYKAESSSVMEYLHVKDERHAVQNWEPYDEAALLFAYSDGKIDLTKEKQFLFCTDEHKIYNALCNTWDRGTSPSEVALSLIEDYEERYLTMNLRDGRAYWDSSSYPRYMFGKLLDIKRFLVMWTNVFRSDYLNKEITKRYPSLSSVQRSRIIEQLNRHAKQAVKLTLGFYNAIIQQSSAERPWRTEYDDYSGELMRVGILPDKIFAALFLMGDDPLVYNPSLVSSSTTYMTYSENDEFSRLMDYIYQNMVTIRVEAEPWFIGFARVLYALAATNPRNEKNTNYIEKLGVQEYSYYHAEQIFGKDFFKHSKEGDDIVVPVSVPEDATSGIVREKYFREGETVAYAIDGNRVFVTSRDRNPYAYSLVNLLTDAKRGEDSRKRIKKDIAELAKLYRGEI